MRVLMKFLLLHGQRFRNGADVHFTCGIFESGGSPRWPLYYRDGGRGGCGGGAAADSPIRVTILHAADPTKLQKSPREEEYSYRRLAVSWRIACKLCCGPGDCLLCRLVETPKGFLKFKASMGVTP